MLKSAPISNDLISTLTVEKSLNSPTRLAALERTRLLDSEPEEAFDRATRLASKLLQVPVSVVSLVTPERQFFKAQKGLSEPLASKRGTPLSHSFCQYVVATRGPLIVNDARKDPLVRDNKAVSELGVRAYLGVPLREPGGEVLGAFCVIDSDPRDWSDSDLSGLEDIAASLGSEIGLHMRMAELRRSELALKDRHRETLRLSRELRQNAGNLLAVVTAIMSLSARTDTDVPAALSGLGKRASALAKAHMACMTDDPHNARLAMLARSVLGRHGPVTIQGPDVTLPNQYVTSIGLILHEWAAAFKPQPNAEQASVSWTVSGPTLCVDCSSPSSGTREPSHLDRTILDAAARELGGSIAYRSEEGYERMSLTARFEDRAAA